MGGSGAAQAPPPARNERIDFAIERQRHRRFVGREDVLARLDEWLLGPEEAGWVVVTGGPGMGKSAILSAWLGRREAAGVAVPHHFVRRQVIDWDQPERIAASLAAQIEAMFPALRDPEARPEGRLLELRACAVMPDGGRVVSASADGTLKVWDLASGLAVATLEGHAATVHACAVTPDGRRVVSASNDRTLKVWDLDTNICLLTHRTNATFYAVTVTSTTIVAGDAVGALWFLDWPPPDHRGRSLPAVVPLPLNAASPRTPSPPRRGRR